MASEKKSEFCSHTLCDVENVVSPFYENLGLTGLYSDHPFQLPFEKVFPKVEGWKWDRRKVENFKLNRTFYNWQVGGHTFGLKDGTSSDHWQSGTILNTEFLGLKQYRFKKDFLSWTPYVKAGQYSILFEPKNLFSDFSSTEKFILDNKKNDGYYHKLRDDAHIDTVSAVIYRRDKGFINWPYRTYKEVDFFTGKLVEGDGVLTRLETVLEEADKFATGTEEVYANGEVKYYADPASTVWENCSERLYERITHRGKEGSEIYFNGDPSIDVGNFPENQIPTTDALECLFEKFGNGNPSGRDCFTQYFPLADNTVRVFISDGKLVEEYKEVENLHFSKPEDKHYTVDHDLGIITIGGYQAPDLRLKVGVSSEDTEIICYEDDPAFDSYPPQGTINVNGEQILYYGKSKNRFYDCVRGYEDTIAKAHERGALVSDRQHGFGPKVSSQIFVSYKAVPRIEYEVTAIRDRSANRTPFVNLKATNNAVTNNIIQISPVEIHVANLVLETDSPIISDGNLWGPVFYGTDFSRLTARATDSLGNPVEGIPITIVLDSEVGSLNGGFKEHTSISNSLGETYAIYNAPYEWEAIRKVVHEVKHENGNTIFKLDKLPPGVTGQEVSVFQTYKFDRNIGTVGMKMNVLSASNSYEDVSGDVYSIQAVTGDASPLPMNLANIVVDAVFEDPASQWKSWQRTDLDLPHHSLHDGDGADTCPSKANTNYGNAVVSILFKNKVTGSFTMIHRKIWDAFDVYSEAEFVPGTDHKDPSDCDDPKPEHVKAYDLLNNSSSSIRRKLGTRFVFRTHIPETLLIDYEPVKCWALEKDSEVWNADFRDGLDVILYEWNEDIPHPIKAGELGAYFPVRPDATSSKSITFYNKELAIPNPSNSWPGIENILGGYNVVCPDMVEFHAWCRDPVSGRIILSNKIRLKLIIPPYLEGVDFSGALPVPKGFGFVNDEHNIVLVGGEEDSEVGTGIGGANFLTINPVADSLLGGANAFSMQLDPE